MAGGRKHERFACFQYKWLTSDTLKDPTKVKQKKRRVKTLHNNFGRKTTVKVREGGAEIEEAAQQLRPQDHRQGA